MAELLFGPTPHEKALAFIKGKPALSASVFHRLLPDLKGLAFTVTGVEDVSVIQRVRDRVASLPQGVPWEVAKKQLVKDLHPWLDDEESGTLRAEARAELLLRTHGFQAYQSAAHVVMEAQRDVFPYWQYKSMEDGRVRPAHAALDGIVLPANHEFWKTHWPPWQWNCRCQCIPLSDDDYQDVQKEDAKRAKDQKLILNDAAQEELTKTRRLVRNGVTYNVSSDAEKGKEGAYRFDPENLRPDLSGLKQRTDPAVFAKFEQWAKKQELPDAGGGEAATVWEWLSGVGKSLATDLPEAPARQSPVSQAVKVEISGPLKRRVLRGIAAVDAAHDDGALPSLPINRKLTSAKNLGEYRSPLYPHWKHGGGIGIRGGLRGTHPELTACHEVGHFLDEMALLPHPALQHYASELSPELKAWRDAVDASPKVGSIRLHHATATGRKHREYYEYLLSKRELFARSYAQYIARKSGDRVLLDQVAALQKGLTQWPDAEFQPIHDALDALFQSKGWI